jgi:hypothetical protein
MKLKSIGEAKERVTPADSLALLANLEVAVNKRLLKQYRSWLSSASEEDQLDYLYDVSQFAGQIGLPMNQLAEAGDDDTQKKKEALFFYAMAVWRAFELKTRH